MLAVAHAVMDSQAPDPEAAQTASTSSNIESSGSQDFLQSGRTGRRNALGNILSEHATVGSSDLPSQLEGLTTKDSKNETPHQPPPAANKS